MGRSEWQQIALIIKHVKAFTIEWHDLLLHNETTITKTLVLNLGAVAPGISSLGVTPVSFADETFYPDVQYRGLGVYPLLGGEAKKLHDLNAKRAWKEALAQAMLYATVYKVVLLILYDFTMAGHYKKAFGAGNKSASSFARRLRRERIYVIVIAPAP